MPKLHLKETPEERAWRKSQRAARKSKKRSHSPSPQIHHNHNYEPSPRRWRLRTPEIVRMPASSTDNVVDDDDDAPSSRAEWIEYERLKAEMEEAQFRSKLFDAMEDDTRLDGIEATFNDYPAYIPRRWQGSSSSARDTHDDMDEDEYAEWVRRGMWERTHKAEKEERERKERERKERKEREKKEKREWERKQAEEEAARARRRLEREQAAIVATFVAYDRLWSTLSKVQEPLRFTTLPWPVHPAPRKADDLESLTKERISAFLFSETHSRDIPRRTRLREALRAYHPDRFGRWMAKVDESERAIVEEANARVVRALTALAEEDVVQQ